MAQLRAGFPVDVPLTTVNRQCSSGLQVVHEFWLYGPFTVSNILSILEAVANVYAAIKAGVIDAGIGAGVESMTMGGGVAPGSGKSSAPPMNIPQVLENALARECLVPMGITAENIAERYGVTRTEQDQMGYESHMKALKAQEMGYFNDEIVPVTTVLKNGDEERTITVTKDDGPRAGTSLEGLGKLKTVFKEDGSITAGTSSQVSDGAAAVLLMRRLVTQKQN